MLYWIALRYFLVLYGAGKRSPQDPQTFLEVAEDTKLIIEDTVAVRYRLYSHFLLSKIRSILTHTNISLSIPNGFSYWCGENQKYAPRFQISNFSHFNPKQKCLGQRWVSHQKQYIFCREKKYLSLVNRNFRWWRKCCDLAPSRNLDGFNAFMYR